ncbi:hypothetical protein ABZP36_026658 [Zizania latifolia]
MKGGRKTASTCTPGRSAEATHVFDIIGYSQHRGMGAHDPIKSGTFSVGGLDWAVFFYPEGYCSPGMDFVSAYLRLLGEVPGKLLVSCDVRLVDQTTGLSSKAQPYLNPSLTFGPDKSYKVLHCMMMQRAELETAPYLVDDRLTMEFVVTVRKDPQVSKTRQFPVIKAPPPNITRQLSKLLETKEGADVTFNVAGETFAAHKLVLAMRSPVFKAELFGPMRETGTQPITIMDMQPVVFKALLQFIYTDRSPVTRDFDGDNYNEMIRHLLVAADRYAVDRLKLICQKVLCQNLDVQNVATTLALADQHQCDKLKDACIEFMSCPEKMNGVVATQGYADL